MCFEKSLTRNALCFNSQFFKEEKAAKLKAEREAKKNANTPKTAPAPAGQPGVNPNNPNKFVANNIAGSTMNDTTPINDNNVNNMF